MSAYSEYQFKYRNLDFKFAVSDPKDIVQSHHTRGVFYEVEELEYIRTLLPRKSIVADVGANVGNHSLFFSKVCGAASVIAFEVNEEAIDLLKANVAINFADAIDLRHVGCAVGTGGGFVTKKIQPLHNLGATTFVPSQTETEYRTESLDTLIGGREVDFIKIDVEGMEFDVLNGAADTIRKRRPILFIEVRKGDLERYFSAMSSIGYRTERTFQRYRGVFTFLALHGR